MTVIRATGSQLATQASVRGSASELELRASGFAQHARVLHPRYTGHAAEEQTRPLYTTLLHAPRSSITLNSSKPATLPLSEVFGAFTPRPALFQEGLQHTCAACQHRAYTGAQSACRQRCGSLLLQSMAQLCCTCLKGARASPPLHLTAPLMAHMLCRPYAAGTTLWEPAEQAAGADADIGVCATVGGASRLRAGLSSSARTATSTVRAGSMRRRRSACAPRAGRCTGVPGRRGCFLAEQLPAVAAPAARLRPPTRRPARAAAGVGAPLVRPAPAGGEYLRSSCAAACPHARWLQRSSDRKTRAAPRRASVAETIEARQAGQPARALVRLCFAHSSQGIGVTLAVLNCCPREQALAADDFGPRRAAAVYGDISRFLEVRQHICAHVGCCCIRRGAAYCCLDTGLLSPASAGPCLPYTLTQAL